MELIIKNIRGYVTERKIKLAIRVILGGVFIVAGIAKLFEPNKLLQQIEQFLFIPELAVYFIAYCLMVFEIILGIFLLAKPNKLVFRTVIGMLLFFCVFLSYKILTHDPSVCGCFGNFILRSNHQELTNNLILFIGIVYIY